MSSPAETYQVRPGTDADIPEVVELMRLALGEGKIPRTREFWTWKHRQNPFGASPMWLATAGEALVGVRLFMRWSWAFRGGANRLDAVRAVDTATHPEWQGKGIFKRLTLGLVEQLTLDGTAFVFNTPNQKSRPGYLKMGWQQVGRLSLWVKPCRPLRALSSLITRSRAAQDDAVETDQAQERALLREVERSELLARAARRVSGYATPLSGDYFDWRYLRCPAASYRIMSTDARRALLVVRSRTRMGLRELTVTDLVVESSLQGVRAGLDSVRAAIARDRPDYMVAALRSDGTEAAVLAAAGFVPAPRLGPILTVRPLAGSPAAPNPTKGGSFSASIGDLELF
jgi:GNAT superfamily N-acetyltransferase